MVGKMLVVSNIMGCCSSLWYITRIHTD